MGSARIKGKALMLEIDGTDHWADFTSVFIDNEEADQDTVTFEDAAAGGKRQWYMEFTAIQSTDTASFWSYVFDNVGPDEIAYTYAPHGNAVATAAQPHFTGSLKIETAPRIGGEAGEGDYTFEGRFNLSGKPVKDTGA